MKKFKKMAYKKKGKIYLQISGELNGVRKVNISKSCFEQFRWRFI